MNVLFKRIVSFSIKSKLTICFLALGLLPLLVFGVISYQVYLESLQKNITTYTFEVIASIDKNFETYISDIDNILQFKEDYYAQQYLKLYEAGDIDENRKYTVRIWETFDTLKKMKTDLADIKLIDHSGHVISCYGTYWEDLDTNPLFDELKYKPVGGLAFLSPYHSKENKYVFSLGKIFGRGTTEGPGMMCIDISVDFLDKICNDAKLGVEGYVYIADENGNAVYLPQDSAKISYKAKIVQNPLLMNTADGSFIEKIYGINYMVTFKTSHVTGWKIIGVSPMSEMTSNIKKLNRIFYWLIPTIVIIIMLLTIYLTAILTKPIRELRSVMKQASENDLSIHIKIKSKDEIGQLADSFNIMINKIRELMKNVVDDQLKIRKMEMKAMQELIKPHFVYNTLDSIIGLLEQNRNNDAINMVDSLGKFFRTSLSHGREMVQMQEELDHIRSYLTIQLFRFSNKFDYIFEVDDTVYKYKTIKLILQPLVENSIYHGIRNMGKQGLIIIKCYIEGDEIRVEILDNGEGMDVDKIKYINSILSGEERVSDENLFFGIRNVNERIKLNFGVNYGLRYDEKMAAGTRVIVNIPVVR
jgi:two-component system, sensor histidine kinase YesM